MNQADQDDDGAEQPWEIGLGRNPSYLASLWLTLKRVLFYAPESWWYLVGPHLTALCVVLFNIASGTLYWALHIIIATIAGLLGFVKRRDQTNS